MAKFFRDPAVAVALEAVSVAMALIIGLYTFGALLYVNNHHAWGLTLFIIGSVLAICVLLGVGFVPVRGVLRFVKQIRIVLPSDEPPEHQWILDIAKEDAENPSRFLLITDAVLTDDVDLSDDLERPYIGLGVELHNCNVHTVIVGGTGGRARINGKELREAIIGSPGKSSMPRGHKQVYKMRQYLSPEQAKQIMEERREETRVCGGQRRKVLRSLDLSGVAIEVECEGRISSLGLGSVQSFRYD